MYQPDQEPALGASVQLSDQAFVSAFERQSLSADMFRHSDHVRLAWIYLRRMPLLDAIRIYEDGLRRFATAHGVPQLYHATVTWAFLFLINERLNDDDEDCSWPEFASRNPDLLRWRDGALFRYYEPDVLTSDLAKRVFVLPKPRIERGLAASGAQATEES